MHRIKTNRSGEMPHPVNPVNPVKGSGVNEIIGKFGGADQLRTAVNQLQSLLYGE